MPNPLIVENLFLESHVVPQVKAVDSPAVRAYRDKFKLNLNASRKRDIDLTIRSDADLELWKIVLNSWGYWSRGKWVSFNPLSIGKMLSEWERLERKRESGSVLAYAERL